MARPRRDFRLPDEGPGRLHARLWKDRVFWTKALFDLQERDPFGTRNSLNGFAYRKNQGGEGLGPLGVHLAGVLPFQQLHVFDVDD